MTTTTSSQTRVGRILRSKKRLVTPLGLLLLLPTIGNSAAAEPLIAPANGRPSVALAQYVASLQKRDPFSESGPVGVLIEASVPALYKEAALVALRELGDDERSRYVIFRMGGDGAVVDEVMARYFALEQQMEALPVSSIVITSANYSFRFQGEVRTGGNKACVYDITPRKNRPFAIKGQLWMDEETGAEVMVRGRLTVPPSMGGGVDMVRETKLMNGSAVVRTTHFAFLVPRLGRSLVIVTEYALGSDDDARPPESPAENGVGTASVR
jgi:hypothetical protein